MGYEAIVVVSLSEWKDIATIGGVVIALIAFVKGVIEYMTQGAQRRAEQFFEMSERLFAHPTFKKIAALLNDEDPTLATVSFDEKFDFLGLFEEVALMLNSGLVRESVAHYIFGYYAILCWESEAFWANLSRESIYWQVFAHFAARMKAVEQNFEYRESLFRF